MNGLMPSCTLKPTRKAYWPQPLHTDECPSVLGKTHISAFHPNPPERLIGLTPPERVITLTPPERFIVLTPPERFIALMQMVAAVAVAVRVVVVVVGGG